MKTLSKAQWTYIGQQTGWLSKQANGWGHFSGDLTDIIEAKAIMGLRSGLTPEQIAEEIKTDEGLKSFLIEELVTDEELLECIKEEMEMYRLTAGNKSNVKTSNENSSK